MTINYNAGIGTETISIADMEVLDNQNAYLTIASNEVLRRLLSYGGMINFRYNDSDVTAEVIGVDPDTSRAAIYVEGGIPGPKPSYYLTGVNANTVGFARNSDGSGIVPGFETLGSSAVIWLVSPDSEYNPVRATVTSSPSGYRSAGASFTVISTNPDATAITIAPGSNVGTLNTGDFVRFGSDTTDYEIIELDAAAGVVRFNPALGLQINGQTINRRLFAGTSTLDVLSADGALVYTSDPVGGSSGTVTYSISEALTNAFSSHLTEKDEFERVQLRQINSITRLLRKYLVRQYTNAAAIDSESTSESIGAEVPGALGLLFPFLGLGLPGLAPLLTTPPPVVRNDPTFTIRAATPKIIANRVIRNADNSISAIEYDIDAAASTADSDYFRFTVRYSNPVYKHVNVNRGTPSVSRTISESPILFRIANQSDAPITKNITETVELSTNSSTSYSHEQTFNVSSNVNVSSTVGANVGIMIGGFNAGAFAQVTAGTAFDSGNSSTNSSSNESGSQSSRTETLTDTFILQPLSLYEIEGVYSKSDVERTDELEGEVSFDIEVYNIVCAKNLDWYRAVDSERQVALNNVERYRVVSQFFDSDGEAVTQDTVALADPDFSNKVNVVKNTFGWAEDGFLPFPSNTLTLNQQITLAELSLAADPGPTQGFRIEKTYGTVDLAQKLTGYNSQGNVLGEIVLNDKGDPFSTIDETFTSFEDAKAITDLISDDANIIKINRTLKYDDASNVSLSCTKVASLYYSFIDPDDSDSALGYVAFQPVFNSNIIPQVQTVTNSDGSTQTQTVVTQQVAPPDSDAG